MDIFESGPIDMASENARLRASIAQLEKEKAETAKLVAMLEFNNEHNKNKVYNMELSHAHLSEKMRAQQEELDNRNKSDVEKKLLRDIQELDERLSKEKTELQMEILKEKRKVEEALESEKAELVTKYEEEVRRLTGECDGLREVCDGYAKQIKQIEENNSSMHIKLSGVQEARDEAKSEASSLRTENSKLEVTISQLTQGKSQTETKLANETRLRQDLEEQLKSIREKASQFEVKVSELESSELKLKQEIRELCSSKERLCEEVATLIATKADLNKSLETRSAEMEQLRQQLDVTNDKLTNIATKASGADHLKEEIERLKEQLESEKKASAKDKEDKIAALENEKLASAGKRDQKISMLEAELKSKEEDVARRIIEARESARLQLEGELRNVAAGYCSRLTATSLGGEKKETSAVDSGNIQQQEGATEELLRQVEEVWRGRTDNLLLQKEQQLREELQGLQQQWDKERKELERLTGVAAAAFRSGTDSVELLRTQVQQQRDELQQLKHQHQLEVRELRALLEVKQRRRKGDVAAGVKGAGALEDVAEYEYLKNVLYQFMVGKETKTLTRVLCAVVKFDQEQQSEIAAYQESQTQSRAIEDQKKESSGLAVTSPLPCTPPTC